ncbi:MAG TPA: hypothetical protein VFE15_09700 [Marmoricola sp.]|jgi:hypothetical protein|nr:hypothetical protein [Marmoricola sp.]
MAQPSHGALIWVSERLVGIMAIVPGHGDRSAASAEASVDADGAATCSDDDTDNGATEPAVDMREQVDGYIYITGDGRVPLPEDGSPVTDADWEKIFGGDNGDYSAEFEDDDEDLEVAASLASRRERALDSPKRDRLGKGLRGLRIR